jgi:hypothetical protein
MDEVGGWAGAGVTGVLRAAEGVRNPGTTIDVAVIYDMRKGWGVGRQAGGEQ